MNAQQLRNSILQMAVQGKLVPQDPNDEPASVLIERIRKEKEKLIKEGKIKKEKNSSFIFRGADNTPYEKIGNNKPVSIEDEIPYEIPDSWEWVRLGNIFQHNTGKALNHSNQLGKQLEYITTSNVYWNSFKISSLRKMFFTEAEIEKCTVVKGDLLVCEGGDIGRTAIWPYDFNICIQNHIHRLRSYRVVSNEFFYYVLYLYKHIGLIGGKGIGIKGLSSNYLHNILFPFPPLAEQKRIVAKLKKTEPDINRYESADKILIGLNKEFLVNLKKSILQLAIQGKLVPQNKTDEPASILLQRILAEKEKLINAGKIKRDKNESIIFRRDNSYYEKIGNEVRCIDNEIPFEIPDSWEWSRVSALGTMIRGKGIKRNDLTTKGLPCLRYGEIYTTYNISFNKTISKIPIELDKHCVHLNKNDIAFTLTGENKPDIAKTIAYLGEEPVAVGGDLACWKYHGMLPLYLVYYMSSPYAISKKCDLSTGDIIVHISTGKIGSFLIPIPSIAEQQRIVKKINEMLNIVKELYND